MIDAQYIENSIAVSRNYQEQANCLQGITGYGKFATLIGTNMEYFDSFAEYIALCVSSKANKERYISQYGTDTKGFLKRNLVNMETAHKNEKERRNIAFVESLLIEAGVKYGVRGLQKLAEKKEESIYFENVFNVLKLYLEESDNYIFYENGKKELKKILNSFPLDARKKQQIWLNDTANNYEKIESFTSQLDSDAKYSLAYFLYAIHAQKYGDNLEEIKILRQYYSLLGYSDVIINEIICENRDAYGMVAFDQKRYLSLARGMLKQFDLSLPEINMDALAKRSVEMSKFDPYYSNKFDFLHRGKYKAEKTISDVFFESPDTVINACKTSISQLVLDDNIKENIEKKLTSWNIDLNTIMDILNQADTYQGDIKNKTWNE